MCSKFGVTILTEVFGLSDDFLLRLLPFAPRNNSGLGRAQ